MDLGFRKKSTGFLRENQGNGGYLGRLGRTTAGRHDSVAAAAAGGGDGGWIEAAACGSRRGGGGSWRLGFRAGALWLRSGPRGF